MERRILHGNSYAPVSGSEDSVANGEHQFSPMVSDKIRPFSDSHPEFHIENKCLKYNGGKNPRGLLPAEQKHAVCQVLPEVEEKAEIIFPEETAKRRTGKKRSCREEDEKFEEEDEERFFEESSSLSSEKPTITFSHVCTVTESEKISFDAIRKTNSRSPSPLLEVPTAKSEEKQETRPPL